MHLTHKQKILAIIYVLIVIFFVGILFIDGILTKRNILSENKILEDDHFVADKIVVEEGKSEDFLVEYQGGSSDIHSTQIIVFNENIVGDDETIGNDTVSDIEAKRSSREKIAFLEQTYKIQQEKKEFVELIQELVEGYEFKQARKYLSEIDIMEDKQIDPQMYLYIYINNLSLISDRATNIFSTQLIKLKNNSLIPQDSYIFYQGLVDIRNNDIIGGIEKLSSITAPMYKDVAQNLIEIHTKIQKQRDIPLYYQDALFSLELFKQGYFSIAKKLSLRALESNIDYILPYQILAYANYLTNSWDAAIEYFYKLLELEPSKYNSYKYMIGSSYYWKQSYTDSLLHLSQIQSPEYQTNVYRYQILNYLALEDNRKLMKTRHQLLSQTDMNESDFSLFRQKVLWEPYMTNGARNIYDIDRQISFDFVLQCSNKINHKEICIFGQVGLDVIRADRDKPGMKDRLIYLSEHMPSVEVFRALGEFYTYEDDIHAAKDAYLQAMKYVRSSAEKGIVQKKLSELF